MFINYKGLPGNIFGLILKKTHKIATMGDSSMFFFLGGGSCFCRARSQHVIVLLTALNKLLLTPK